MADALPEKRNYTASPVDGFLQTENIAANTRHVLLAAQRWSVQKIGFPLLHHHCPPRQLPRL
eukprot:scaffold169625_cov12-Tisochrysis_lutea.AAC.1